MITSWNEWKESTAIEPSVENGDLLMDSIIPEFLSVLVSPVILILATSTSLGYIKRARQRSSTR